jgi:SAM-dependent methyltransferase
MKLQPDDLKQIASVTLRHYDDRADEFWRGTSSHDVSQNIEALLKYVEAKPPFAILDLGCGPGRDLKAFRDLGHAPVGLDGSKRFVEMAREAGYECGSRTCWRSTCRPAGSMAYSLTRCCFMYRVRNCREYYRSCILH